MARTMRLGVFHSVAGQHAAAWRVSTQPLDPESFAQHRAAALLAQDAMFHFLFVTDVLGETGTSVSPAFLPRLEPGVLLSALAAATEHIGLVGSFSTTFSEPYQLARQLSSLDHVSAGRAGWNVVTSYRPDAAQAFGRPLPDHVERYAKAADFLEAALALWDAWQPGAVVRDRRTGAFVDPARVTAVDHASTFHRVHGLLPVSRSPQGRPVLFQSGASDDGRTLAARYADVVVTSEDDLDEARRFYADVKDRAADGGRDPDQVLVLPGVMTILGATREQAHDLHGRLLDAIDDDAARRRLSALLGWDTSVLPAHAPVPPAPALTEGARSRARLLHERAAREGLTIGGLARVVAATRGHRLLVGTPRDVADELEAWFTGGAADGFVVGTAVMPSGLRRFARDVVPLLQDRGVFRRERAGGRTLREQLGLAPLAGAATPPRGETDATRR